jgi:iron uptake system component EfeO
MFSMPNKCDEELFVTIRKVAGWTMVGVLALAACGSDDDDAGSDTTAAATVEAGAAAGAIPVSITAEGCDPAALTATAGDVVFAVTNARADTDRSSEFEILTAEPKILAEEFFDTGEARDVTVTLAAGDYELICGSPNQPRGTLTVTGEGGESAAPSDLKVDAVALQANVDAYTTYVDGQLQEMVTANAAFRDAIVAGDLDLAKSLYMPSRVQWEKIEPIAELFPDLDGSMDARADDFEAAEEDPNFTGWHKLEWLMFDQGTLDGAVPVADKLVADIDSLTVVLSEVEIDAATMVNGSAGLIEEAANGKITGEEERYAKTDLLTFASNVEGAKVIVDINADLLKSVDQPLYDAIIASFDSIDAGLSKYDNGDGTYKSYDELTDADRRPLQAELATLSENLAKVAGAFGLEVS